MCHNNRNHSNHTEAADSSLPLRQHAHPIGRDEAILTVAETKAVVNGILNSSFGGSCSDYGLACVIVRLLLVFFFGEAGCVLQEDCATYFGSTGRLVAQEWDRWGSQRGSATWDKEGNIVGWKYNRPTILWSDKSVIKGSELSGELQFETHELYASTLKVNARQVEDALQVRRCLLAAAWLHEH